MSISLNRVQDLRMLRPGDTVEARRHGDVLYRGRVEALAPTYSVAWVRDDATGCRAMLQTGVFEVFVLSRALAA